MEQTLLQPGKYLVGLMQQVTEILALLTPPVPEKRTLLLENCLLDQILKTCPPLYKRACGPDASGSAVRRRPPHTAFLGSFLTALPTQPAAGNEWILDPGRPDQQIVLQIFQRTGGRNMWGLSTTIAQHVDIYWASREGSQQIQRPCPPLPNAAHWDGGSAVRLLLTRLSFSRRPQPPRTLSAALPAVPLVCAWPPALPAARVATAEPDWVFVGQMSGLEASGSPAHDGALFGAL